MPHYVVIEWFGLAPRFCTDEDGYLLIWDNKDHADTYAANDCQIGSVVEIPYDAYWRISGEHNMDRG